MRRPGRLMVAAAVLLPTTGCGSVAPDEDSAAYVAAQFRSAVQSADGAAACALLAPETASEVAQSADKPCPEAILGALLPGSGGVRRIDAFGQDARVVFADDTVFLASFANGWRVMAAGCTPRENRPYDCDVKGG